jgi:hypothetical protein
VKYDEFYNTAGTLFPTLDTYDITFHQVPYGDEIISDAEDDDPITVPVISRGNVEKIDLLLPSTFPLELPAELNRAKSIEVELRVAQAEEALEEIRREICHKSYIYRTNVRLANDKKGKIRGYAALHAADRALRHYIRIYKQARWSLQHLNAPREVLDKFMELRADDIQPLKSIYLPNARGQSTASVPWIWKLHRSEANDSAYLNECMYLLHRH